MHWDSVEGNWKQFKGAVEAPRGKLTDDHPDVIDGKRFEAFNHDSNKGA